MEKENKKATASEKLTKVVAIRISQTDYDIFLEKAKMENPESTKINISKYLCSVLPVSYTHLTLPTTSRV